MALYLKKDLMFTCGSSHQKYYNFDGILEGRLSEKKKGSRHTRQGGVWLITHKMTWQLFEVGTFHVLLCGLDAVFCIHLVSLTDKIVYNQKQNPRYAQIVPLYINNIVIMFSSQCCNRTDHNLLQTTFHIKPIFHFLYKFKSFPQ